MDKELHLKKKRKTPISQYLVIGAFSLSILAFGWEMYLLKEQTVKERNTYKEAWKEEKSIHQELMKTYYIEQEWAETHIAYLNEQNEELQVVIQDLEQQIETKLMNEPKKLDVVATAYVAFCDTGCIGITKNGTNVKHTVYKDGLRVIAVDPSVIPLNSIVLVKTKDNSFLAIADDTGGAIKKNRIDILVENEQTAVNFGKQDVEVIILKEGENL